TQPSRIQIRYITARDVFRSSFGYLRVNCDAIEVSPHTDSGEYRGGNQKRCLPKSQAVFRTYQGRTTPSAPTLLAFGIIFLMARPPLLCKEGNSLHLATCMK